VQADLASEGASGAATEAALAAGSGCPAGVVRRVAQQTGPASGPSAAPHPSATVRVEPVTDPATKFVFTPTFRGTEGAATGSFGPRTALRGPDAAALAYHMPSCRRVGLRLLMAANRVSSRAAGVVGARCG